MWTQTLFTSPKNNILNFLFVHLITLWFVYVLHKNKAHTVKKIYVFTERAFNQISYIQEKMILFYTNTYYTCKACFHWAMPLSMWATRLCLVSFTHYRLYIHSVWSQLYAVCVWYSHIQTVHTQRMVTAIWCLCLISFPSRQVKKVL